jgi:hypothetical protein
LERRCRDRNTATRTASPACNRFTSVCNRSGYSWVDDACDSPAASQPSTALMTQLARRSGVRVIGGAAVAFTCRKRPANPVANGWARDAFKVSISTRCSGMELCCAPARAKRQGSSISSSLRCCSLLGATSWRWWEVGRSVGRTVGRQRSTARQPSVSLSNGAGGCAIALASSLLTPSSGTSRVAGRAGTSLARAGGDEEPCLIAFSRCVVVFIYSRTKTRYPKSPHDASE